MAKCGVSLVKIITTYYNAPHFMELQFKTFEKFAGCGANLVIINDAEDDTKSLLSGYPARQEIHSMACVLNLEHHFVPQSVHRNISDGGLVPNGFPANHPTERHRACLHWILNNYQNLGFHDSDITIIAESDLFPRKMIDFKTYGGDYDLLGTGRLNLHLKKTCQPNQYWPIQIKDLDSITIDFFTMYLLFINNENVNNIEQLDIGGFAGTDTGGKTSFFLKDNPQYKHKFLQIGGNKDYQVDFFSNEKPDEDSEFIHYRAGSNWDLQSKDYYKEKLNRMLVKYIPEFAENITLSQKDLSSRDKEHIFKGI